MKILETRWAFCLLTTVLILPLNALAAASADDGNVVNAPPAIAPLEEDYGIEIKSGEELYLPEPEIPDVSGYSRDAIEAKLAGRQDSAPNVTVERMGGVSALGDFVDEGRAREWVIRQFSHPQARRAGARVGDPSVFTSSGDYG